MSLTDLVALGERHVAGDAGEAVDVVDVVLGAHHQLVGGDAAVTPFTPLQRE